ncbi:MAG TPA: TetR/AcrR family transcriptional regulator [Bryobacteraceae bacterium]|nr:TetR/AcrR family transcriptional regulator [Bryobacteraceae bacterium]
MTTKLAARPRLTSEERRASIVAAASKLFSEKGFNGTTTRDLAAAVGVTEPILYEHFKTKRDLYSAIIENKAQEGLTVAQDLAEKYSTLNDDAAFFYDLGVLIMDWYTKDPTFLRLLLYSNLEGHELKELFHERTKSSFEIVATYISRRMAQGAMHSGDPVLVARAYFGMIAHYAMTGVVFCFAPFPGPADEVVREMTQIFLHGICRGNKNENSSR